MTVLRFITALVVCLTIIPVGTAEENPVLIELYQDPHTMLKSAEENWPKSGHGFGIFVSYADGSFQGRKRTNIYFRFNTMYLVGKGFYIGGKERNRVSMSYEGGLREPQVGESFPLINAMVKVHVLEGGQHAHTKLEVLTDEMKKNAKRIGHGFFLSEGGGIGDNEKSIAVDEVLPLPKDDKKLGISLKYYRGFDVNEMINPLKIGDTIQMEHFTLKIIDAEAGDKKAKRRGWIVLEPVLPEPVKIPE